MELALVVGNGEEHLDSDVLRLQGADIENDFCIENIVLGQ